MHDFVSMSLNFLNAVCMAVIQVSLHTEINVEKTTPERYCMFCGYVWKDIPGALASGLSSGQTHKPYGSVRLAPTCI